MAVLFALAPCPCLQGLRHRECLRLPRPACHIPSDGFSPCSLHFQSLEEDGSSRPRLPPLPQTRAARGVVAERGAARGHNRRWWAHRACLACGGARGIWILVRQREGRPPARHPWSWVCCGNKPQCGAKACLHVSKTRRREHAMQCLLDVMHSILDTMTS